MFVIRKYYRGNQFCSVECVSPIDAIRAVRDFMLDCSENPDLSFDFHVEPVTLPVMVPEMASSRIPRQLALLRG